MTIRLNQDQRTRIIVNSAVRVAMKAGLASVTLESVASECLTKTSVGTVRRYFKTISELQLAVVDRHSTSDKLKTEARELGLI